MSIPVIIKITSMIPIGSVLKTPSGRASFTLYHIDRSRVMIRTGKKGSIISIPAQCFEDIPNYLKNKGWVGIGATHGYSDEETLDKFVKSYTKGTSAASYVAPILEICNIIEIDRGRPAEIKLIT